MGHFGSLGSILWHTSYVWEKKMDRRYKIQEDKFHCFLTAGLLIPPGRICGMLGVCGAKIVCLGY